MVTDLFNKVSDDLYHQESESEAPLEWERRYTSMGLSLFRISMQENLLMLDQDGESYETSSDKSHSTRTIGYTLTRSLIASAIFERQTLIYMGEAGPSVLFSPNVDVTIKPVYGLGSGDFHVRESFTGNLACRGLVDLATGEENMSLALDVFAPDTILDEYCRRMSNNEDCLGLYMDLDVELFLCRNPTPGQEGLVDFIIEDLNKAFMTRLTLSGLPLLDTD